MEAAVGSGMSGAQQPGGLIHNAEERGAFSPFGAHHDEGPFGRRAVFQPHVAGQRHAPVYLFDDPGPFLRRHVLLLVDVAGQRFIAQAAGQRVGGDFLIPLDDGAAAGRA